MTAIADKIRKLIAKAESTSHPEEADAFMSKVHQLLEQHGLSLLDLGRLDAEDPLGIDREAAIFSSSYTWARACAVQLAYYYGCQGFWWKLPNNKLQFGVAGRESARVTFSLMFPFVMKQVLNEGRILFNQGLYKSRMKSAASVGNALAIRINGLYFQQSQKEVREGINALVPVDQIDQLLKEEFAGMRQRKQKNLLTDEAARDAAEKISLYAQAGADKNALRIGK